MRSLPLTLLQLALAALAGYAGGRLALDPPEPVPAPPPPAGSVPQATSPPPAATAIERAPTAGSPTAAALSITYRTAVERAAPSVVTIYSARTVPRGLGSRALTSQGLGSGVVVDRAGHVVTNNHVVENADQIVLAMPDGTFRAAKLRGVDPDTDLALLAVDAEGLAPIALGSSKELAVGDVVLAVGNPLGIGQTVTQGIVSAVGRKGIGINPIENWIQTDAAINPGNSGGALIDSAGRLVGINTAILSRGGGSEGIGFAIPVEIVQQVVASLARHGRVARGYLGVSTDSASRGRPGALIVAIQRNGPADRGGMAPGDIVVRLGDREINEPADLVGATLALEPGSKVPVEVLREGRREMLEVKLGARTPLRRPG